MKITLEGVKFIEISFLFMSLKRSALKRSSFELIIICKVGLS